MGPDVTFKTHRTTYPLTKTMHFTPQRPVHPLADLIERRRSIRDFGPAPVTMAQLGELLWAGQTVTGDMPHRRAHPSPGGTHTLTLYVCASRVEGLEPGVYRVAFDDERLEPIAAGDPWPEIKAGATGLRRVNNPALVLAVTTIPQPAQDKYGDFADSWILMETGHCVQNMTLAAVAAGLGSVTVGQFDLAQMDQLLRVRPGEHSFYLLAVGEAATDTAPSV